MKAVHSWKKMIVTTVLLGGLSPLLAEAGSLGKSEPWAKTDCIYTTERPLSDFLGSQGTLNDPPLFFGGVPDYNGWVDNPPVTFALIDYAGLADNKFLGGLIGTTVKGSVIQCALPNGKAKITVALSTTKALGFAQSVEALAANDFNFLGTPTIFGAKAQDVVNGANAAVGPATLLTTFTISAPGATLPDFLDVVNNPRLYAPASLNFVSTTLGTSSNGTKAHLNVHQKAATNKECLDPVEEDQCQFVYSIEKVDLVTAKGSNHD